MKHSRLLVLALILGAIVSTLLLASAPNVAAQQQTSFTEIRRTESGCVALAVHKNTVYTGCRNEVIAYDISSPAQMRQLSVFTEPDEIYELQLSGNGQWLFVNDLSGVRIYDVSNPSNPRPTNVLISKASTYRVSRSKLSQKQLSFLESIAKFKSRVSEQVTLLGNSANQGFIEVEACGIEVVGYKLFVADCNKGLLIFDITDPTKPKELGILPSLQFPFVDVAVEGNRAFVVELFEGVHIVDISDPLKPKKIGKVDSLTSYVRNVRIAENRLITTDTGSSNGPAEVVDLKTLQVVYKTTNGWEAQMRGDWIYVAGDRTLHVVNTATRDWIDFPDQYIVDNREVQLVDNLLIVMSAATGLHILDITTPLTPRVVGRHLTISNAFTTNGSLVGGAYGIYRLDDKYQIQQFTLLHDVLHLNPVGDRIFGCVMQGMFVGWHGLFVLDAATLNVVAKLDMEDGCAMSVARGNLLYATGPLGLHIFDITDPTKPVQISLFPVNSARFQLDGNIAYVSDWDNGVRVIDISDPVKPKEIGSLQVGIHLVNALRLQNGYLWVLKSSPGGLLKVDVSDPTNLRVISSIDIPATAYNLVSMNQYIIVGGAGVITAINIDGKLSISASAMGYTRSDFEIVNNIIVASEGKGGVAWYKMATLMTSTDEPTSTPQQTVRPSATPDPDRVYLPDLRNDIPPNCIVLANGEIHCGYTAIPPTAEPTHPPGTMRPQPNQQATETPDPALPIRCAQRKLCANDTGCLPCTRDNEPIILHRVFLPSLNPSPCRPGFVFTKEGTCMQ